mmetsp:Transcript_81285/g.250907  ORF Transcript_81285/g.250907 Transcript_81285/m.250907 type:complete len:231 (+) Transcript_81285:2-694(+)
MKLPASVLEHTYVLRSEGTDEQLREVIDVFEVEVHADCLCGRCVQCNAWDWRFASRADLQGNPQVGAKTLQAYDEFWVCGGCGKVFWEGSMFEKAVGHFRTFMPNAEEGTGLGSEAGRGDETPASSGGARAASSPAASSKYRSMEGEGFSAQRIRAQLVRDGVLTPGAAPPPVAGRGAVADTACGSPGRTCTRAATAAFFQSAFARGLAAGLDPNEAAAAALEQAAASPC